MAIDWGDAPAASAAVVSLLALGVATRSAVDASRSRKAAERSAAASEDSARSAARSAEAGETSAEAAVRSADIAEKQYNDALPPPVGWDIQSRKKGQFRLVNVGIKTATGVTVDRSRLTGVMVIGAEPPEGTTIRPGGGCSFMLSGDHDAVMPDEVWVTWDGQAEAVPVTLPSW